MENKKNVNMRSNNLYNTRSNNFKDLYEKEKPKEKKNIFLILLLSISIILSFIYIGYNILNIKNIIDYGYTIINSIFILIINICLIFTYKKNKQCKGILTFSSIIMNLYLVFILVTTFNLIKLPSLVTMKDFKGDSIKEALIWADKNDIEVVQTYVNSDNTKEYHIISQSINPNTILNKIDEVEFTISKGPNYNENVILENLSGKTVDDVVEYIDNNHLNNVTINFEVNNEYDRDIVFKQNVSGDMKRNSEIIFTASYGENTNFGDIEMINLKGLSKFKGTLFLKRNALPYKEKYEFSSKYNKNYITNQSIKEKDMITKDTTVDISISKGNKIIVPDLTKMSQSEVTSWVIKNNLKIVFKERYDLKVKLGYIVDSDYKKGDTIEEDSTITVIISKGKLIFKKFTSADEFRSWADINSIKYTEDFQKNKDIKKGDIISFSVNEGDIVNPFENIIITISTGDSTKVPNFINKSKNEISKLCNANKLKCSFYYVGYTYKNKDIATRQSKYAGSEVIEGTSVSIGLSSGIIKDNPNIDTSTPPVTPPPSNCQMKTVYLQAGGSVDETKSMIKGQNSSFKFNFVTGDPGYGNSGSLYSDMFSKYHGKQFNTCNTITIYIVQK